MAKCFILAEVATCIVSYCDVVWLLRCWECRILFFHVIGLRLFIFRTIVYVSHDFRILRRLKGVWHVQSLLRC